MERYTLAYRIFIGKTCVKIEFGTGQDEEIVEPYNGEEDVHEAIARGLKRVDYMLGQ